MQDATKNILKLTSHVYISSYVMQYALTKTKTWIVLNTRHIHYSMI